MKITAGKLAGMKAVSNERGVIAAAAMDQRGSLKKSLAKEKGADVSDAEMEEFKSLVTEVLTKHASAILLDPEWGLPASKRRASGSGPCLQHPRRRSHAKVTPEISTEVGCASKAEGMRDFLDRRGIAQLPFRRQQAFLPEPTAG